MRSLVFAVVAALATTVARAEEPVRFRALPIVIDAGSTPLAAYQVELVVASGTVSLVGVEGSRHPAFVKPPYYDPAALARGRIVLAAFSTSPALPQGPTQMLVLHLREQGEPAYQVRLVVAGNASGERIAARAHLADQP